MDALEKKPEPDTLKLSNVFIEGVFRGRLEVADKKLLNLVAHKILSDDKHSPEVSFDVSDVVDVGVSDKKKIYTDIRDILKRLMDLEFVYDKEEEEHFLMFRFAGLAEYKKGVVRFVLSSAMLDVITALDKGYTRYLLENIKPLRSIHSVRMYELLRQYAGIGRREISLEDLRKLLNCEKKYPQFYSFNQVVIKKAQKEINEKTDISFEIRKKRRSYSVHTLEFIITDKNAPPKPRQANLPGELDQMRLDVERFELELRRAGWCGGDFRAWIGGCGGYEVCKRFWDDVLKPDIERQTARGKLENPGAVIRRGMEQAIKYQSACLEEKTSEKKNTVQDWLKKISALSDVELVELVRSRGDRAVQAYGATAAEIRDNIDITPGVAMCELG